MMIIFYLNNLGTETTTYTMVIPVHPHLNDREYRLFDRYRECTLMEHGDVYCFVNLFTFLSTCQE